MSRSLFLAAVLSASAALAQDDDYPSESLSGVGRFSLEAGWRLTTNKTFYNSYYGGRPDLTRAPGSPGGPLAVGSFAYGISESLELGVDLFAGGERLQLTGQPELTTATYGALVGLRLQSVVPGFGPHGLVPFIGLLAGPTLAYSQFKGATGQEDLKTAYGATLGATLRMNPRWGLTAEYRFVNVRGPVGGLSGQSFTSFNGGGSWFSVGLTYTWPPEQNSHPLGSGLGF